MAILPDRGMPNEGGLWIPTGLPLGAPLLDFGAGTFTRSSEGSAKVGSGVVFSGVDVLRAQDETIGPMSLFEDAASELLTRTEEMDHGDWTNTGYTVTPDATVAPDGVSDADLVECDGTNDQHFLQQVITFPTGQVMGMAFVQQPVSNASPYFGIRLAGSGASELAVWNTATGVLEALVGTLSQMTAENGVAFGSWWRFVCCLDTLAAPGPEIYRPLLLDAIPIIVNPVFTSSNGLYLWGTNCRALCQDQSYIRSGALAGTRAVDVLTYADAPATMKAGKWSVQVAPQWNSVEDAGIVNQLFTFGGSSSNRIAFEQVGGFPVVRVTEGAATKVSSNALTFGSSQVMTIIVDSSEGSVEVVGATTGDGKVIGTPWTMPSGTLQVGGGPTLESASCAMRPPVTA